MSKTLTAMQELIEWCKGAETFTNLLRPSEVIHKATELLEKEKEMIVDAYNTGSTTKTATNNGEAFYKRKYGEKPIPFGIAMLRAKQNYNPSSNDDVPF